MMSLVEINESVATACTPIPCVPTAGARMSELNDKNTRNPQKAIKQNLAGSLLKCMPEMTAIQSLEVKIDAGSACHEAFHHGRSVACMVVAVEFQNEWLKNRGSQCNRSQVISIFLENIFNVEEAPQILMWTLTGRIRGLVSHLLMLRIKIHSSICFSSTCSRIWRRHLFDCDLNPFHIKWQHYLI